MSRGSNKMMKNNAKFSVFLLYFVFLLSLPFSFAHLAAGEDVEIDGYAIDMGYDPERIIAGEPFTLLLSISNSTTEEQLNPRKVWVRIAENDEEEEIVFAGTFLPEARSVSTVMSLPESGAYVLDARFYGDGAKAWAAAEFSIQVEREKDDGMVMAWVLVALGTAVLLIIGYVWYKARTTPYPKAKKH
jgi:hypothetical protein